MVRPAAALAPRPASDTRATPEDDLVAGWAARPGLAVAAGIAWHAVHLGTALAAVVALAQVVGRPPGRPSQILWFLLLAVAASAALAVSERLGRRLLTLRGLLRLSLAFPAVAPSRFAMTLRGGSTKRLERRLADHLADGGSTDPDDGPAVAMLELVAALSVHDQATRGHSERVRAYTELIAEELRLDRSAREALRWGGLIHDIGKLRVPAEILNKSGALTPEEWEMIRRHPEDGAALAASMSTWLGEWVAAVLDHHERWEGGGYPRNLAGSDISLAGRVVAVADAFDVMTSARSYKPPRRPEAARAELVRCAGTHFDPMVVRAFLNISVRRTRRIVGPGAALAVWPAMHWRAVTIGRRIATPVAAAVITGAAVIAAPPVESFSRVEPPAAVGSEARPGAGTKRATKPIPPAPAPAPVSVPVESAPSAAAPGATTSGAVDSGVTTVAGDRSKAAAAGSTTGAGAADAGEPDSRDRKPDGGSRGRKPDDDSRGRGDRPGDRESPTSSELEIDPRRGSIRIGPIGETDEEAEPLAELAPVGAVVCGRARVCEPIRVPLPF